MSVTLFSFCNNVLFRHIYFMTDITLQYTDVILHYIHLTFYITLNFTTDKYVRG